MKRQLVLGLILILLVAVAAGVYVFVDQYQQHQQEQEAQEAAALQLTNFSANAITKLELHTPDPEADYTVEIDEDTSNWVVTDPEDMRINTYYISTLCNYGSAITAAEDLGAQDSATLEKYGLANPISITYYVGEEVHTIYVGNLSSTNEYFYLMREGDDHVYLVDADTAGYLVVTETQLRYRYVVQDSTSDFNHLRLVRGSDVIYDLTTQDGSWIMTAPYQTPIQLDNSRLSSLAISLQQLEIDDFGDTGVTEADYADYGFDTPGYILEFAQEDGTETTLLFEDYDPLVTSYVDCLHVQTGEILVFESSYLSFLQADTGDYMMKTLYQPGIESVTEMTIAYQGSYNDQTLDVSASFTIDHANSTYAWDGNDFSDNAEATSAFQDFFEQAAGLRYEAIHDDTDEREYHEDEVALCITYTLNDNTTHTVSLVPYEENTYWAYIDGAFSYATVRQRSLSNNDKLLDCYTTLMEALTSAEG